jgi:hypothetical protein
MFFNGQRIRNWRMSSLGSRVDALTSPNYCIAIIQVTLVYNVSPRAQFFMTKLFIWHHILPIDRHKL